MAVADNVRPGPRIRVADSIELATYHLGGDGPPLMLLHATGFHAHCWSGLGPTLTGGFSVWALDQRGHGASGKTRPGGLADWSRFVDDLLIVLDALGGDAWYGLGHSLGGTVLLLAEARRPGTFRALCCYEPALLVPTPVQREATAQVALGDIARKRRAVFDSREIALDNYRSKPPFDRFDPDTLLAYVQYGLVDTPDGRVTLACRPEDEASVFEGAGRSGAFDALDEVDAPVRILAGVDQNDMLSQVAEVVAERLSRGSFHRLEGLDHFGPLSDPRRVGDEAAVALDENRPGSHSAVPPRR